MSALTAIAQLLDDLDCHSYSLYATDSGWWTERAIGKADAKEPRVSLRLTIIGRTHYEAVCLALEAKATERVVQMGQRQWWAESDTSARKLLIEGVSFQHHDDWEARR